LGQSVPVQMSGEKNTDTADVWSSGPDKQEGSADDIRGWLRMEDQCNK